MTIVRKNYQLIPSKDINNKKILGSDWTKCTPGHTQPRVMVLYSTFP